MLPTGLAARWHFPKSSEDLQSHWATAIGMSSKQFTQLARQRRSISICPTIFSAVAAPILALKLAAALGVSDSEAQYVLLASRLTGDRQFSLDDHTKIRLACWRAKGLWPLSKHAGMVVRVRFPSAGPRRLRHAHRRLRFRRKGPFQIFGDNFFGAGAREDFSVPREQLPIFFPGALRFAYGFWTEPDGGKVLYSRDYAPMWRLRDDRPPQMLSPFEWIRHEDQGMVFGRRYRTMARSASYRSGRDAASLLWCSWALCFGGLAPQHLGVDWQCPKTR